MELAEAQGQAQEAGHGRDSRDRGMNSRMKSHLRLETNKHIYIYIYYAIRSYQVMHDILLARLCPIIIWRLGVIQ